MIQNRRSLFRRRKSQSKRRKSNGRSRLALSPERLEERTLLTAGLFASGISPWQNPYRATDVNFDLETTPLDALIVINQLNEAGAHNLGVAAPASGEAAASGAEGENGNAPLFVDVNGDMALTPLDVLTVVDTINRAEGEPGDFIEFSSQVTDLDGVPLQDLDGDNVPEIVKNTEFLYIVNVKDQRLPPPRLGAFSAYPVVPVDLSLVSTAYQEEQRLTIDGQADGGTFNLQFGVGNESDPIDVANLLATPTAGRAAVIRTAIESLNGIDPGDVEVNRQAFYTYNIVFTGKLANMDVTNLQPVNVALTSLGQQMQGGVAVQQTIAALPNSQASFFSAVQSAANLAALNKNFQPGDPTKFDNAGVDFRTYKFSPSGSVDEPTPATARLMNIGAAASIVQIGQTFEIDWASGEGPTTPSLLFAVRFTADNTGRLNLQLAPPVAGDNFTPDELTYWPSTGTTANDKLNLFPQDLDLVDFGLPAVVDIIELATAVDDPDAPPLQILEDSGATLIDVLANDSTVNGTKELEQTLIDPPDHGTVIVDTVNDNLTYEPNKDFVGQDTFTYRMNDGAGHFDDAIVSIDVLPVNDAPEFTPQSNSLTIDEGAGPQTVAGWASDIRPGPATAVDEVGQQLTFNETLVNGANLSAADFVSVPSVDETTGNLTFEAKENVNGTAVVDITLSDNGGTANNGQDTSAKQTFTITIDPVNDTPVNMINGSTDFAANRQTLRTDQGSLVFSSANNNELSVDDADGNVQMQVTLSVNNGANNGTLHVTPPQNGSVTIQDNDTHTVIVTGPRDDVNGVLGGNTVTYTPFPGFVGTDDLVITTNDLGNTGKDPGLSGDGASEQDQDTVKIDVVPPEKPFAADDSVTVNEGSGDTVIDVLVNDFDGNGVRRPVSANFSINQNTQPPAGQGAVAISGGAGPNATITYTADADFFGSTSFTYTVTDNPAPDGLNTATVNVTVNPVNDRPNFTATDPPAVLEDEGGTGQHSVPGWVTNFDSGAANEAQTPAEYIVNVTDNPGLFETPPAVDTNGTLTYKTAQDKSGQAKFTVQVRDSGGTDNGGVDTSLAQEFTLTVAAVNDAPVNLIGGSNDFAGNAQTTDDNTDLPFNAANGNLLTVTDVDDANGSGTYKVDLEITNGKLLLGPGTPGGLATDLSAGNMTHWQLDSAATLADINLALDGLIYRPTPGYIGPATLTITSNDGGVSGDENPPVPKEKTDVLQIDVQPFNDPPIARDDNITMPEDPVGNQKTFNVFADNGNGTDSAGPNEDAFQTIRVDHFVVPPNTPGTVQLLNDQTGDFSYTPPGDFFGQVTFTYWLRDDGQTTPGPQTSNAATVTITVTPVNDAPTAVDDDPLLIPHDAQQGDVFEFSVNELLANDIKGPANESSQTLHVVSVSVSTDGVAVQLVDNGTPSDYTDDKVVYTVPALAVFDHEDSFMYQIQDDGKSGANLDPDPKQSVQQGTATVRDLTPADIKGRVYQDLNGNGQWDAGETGIEGVKIVLEAPQGVDLTGGGQNRLETVTDQDGNYVFAQVLPNVAQQAYTITEEQPARFMDGPDDFVLRPIDQLPQPQKANNEQELLTDTIPAGTNDVISVTLPRTGYADGANDNNNFGEGGILVGDEDNSSVDPRDLLSSDLEDNSLMDTGLLFAVDANGNLQWKMNIGGWKDYVPGWKAIGSQTYANAKVETTNGNTWRVTEITGPTTSQNRTVDLLNRFRWDKFGDSTVYRIYGAADIFGLPLHASANPEGEGQPITEDQAVEMLAAAGDGAAYAAAVDAAFAEAANMSA